MSRSFNDLRRRRPTEFTELRAEIEARKNARRDAKAARGEALADKPADDRGAWA